MPAYMPMQTRYSGGLPERIKIGPMVYEVVLEPKPKAVDEKLGEVVVFGKVHFGSTTITIDSELKYDVQLQCFLHEIMHVVYEQLGMEEPEGATDAVAYKLLEVLLDNNFFQFPTQETTLRTIWDLGPYLNSGEVE